MLINLTDIIDITDITANSIGLSFTTDM